MYVYMFTCIQTNIGREKGLGKIHACHVRRRMHANIYREKDLGKIHACHVRRRIDAYL